MKRRDVQIVEERGRRLVRVPLGPRATKHAEMWEDDYSFLLMLGLTGNFNCVKGAYVTAAAWKTKGGSVLVSRVLLDAGPGESVAYGDKNPLNLRRENLRLVPSQRGARRDRDFLTRPSIHIRADSRHE